MSERKALTPGEIEAALHMLPGWSVVDSETDSETPARELYKRFVFADFAHAIAFMSAAREPIDKLNHHPRWENVWNRLDVYLSTHDIGNQVSPKDVELAQLLESLYAGAKDKA